MPSTRIAVVTGASSGIGRATAIALNAAGWTVVVTARREDALRHTVSLMPQESRHKSKIICGDMTKVDDIQELFMQVKREYGRLDLLFNNAGISTPKVMLDELEVQSAASVFSVNVMGPFICCQEAIKIMKTQEPMGGRIINNGSISAYTPRPLSAPYTMSKHAIAGLTKCIALDYREYKIACSQLDIGNASTVMSASKTSQGILQPNGQIQLELSYDVSYAGEAVVYMASLPLHVNVLNQTLMATNMPLVGRG